jgi:hypothetical protein
MNNKQQKHFTSFSDAWNLIFSSLASGFNKFFTRRNFPANRIHDEKDRVTIETWKNERKQEFFLIKLKEDEALQKHHLDLERQWRRRRRNNFRDKKHFILCVNESSTLTAREKFIYELLILW